MLIFLFATIRRLFYEIRIEVGALGTKLIKIDIWVDHWDFPIDRDVYGAELDHLG